MYLMISTYLRPIEEVDAIRPEHSAFIESVEERGLLVGAGRRRPPVGGIVLLDVATEEEARMVMADDPYVHGGYAEYEPVGWTPTRGLLSTLAKPDPH